MSTDEFSKEQFQAVWDEFLKRIREEFSDRMRNYRDYIINNYDPNRGSAGIVRGDEQNAIDPMQSRSGVMEDEFEERVEQIWHETLERYQLESLVSESEAE